MYNRIKAKTPHSKGIQGIRLMELQGCTATED